VPGKFSAGFRGVMMRFSDFLREVYLTPYRGVIARAKRQEDDLFMLLVYSEMLGIPNSASYFTLELQPLLYEEFHDWHRRMGMDHSPLDWFRCC
jgi:hypothetical protein